MRQNNAEEIDINSAEDFDRKAQKNLTEQHRRIWQDSTEGFGRTAQKTLITGE